MISRYVKIGRMDEDLNIFNNMPEHNIVSKNTVITGFLLNGNVALAIESFK